MTYGITITNTSTSPPTVGWALDGVKPVRFDAQEDADKAAARLRRNTRYSWHNCRVEAVEIGEKGDKRRT